MKEKEIKAESLKAIESGCAPGEYVFRQDEAKVVKEPLIVVINGLISSPRKWIEKRKSIIDVLKSHIIVDRVNMVIKLHEKESDFYGTIINGILKLNPEMVKFGINSNKTYTPDELANVVKMNRHFFEKNEIAMKLVALLKDFEAKVNTEIKEKDNNRGNTTSLRQQVVTSNLPEKFVLKMQVFLGMEKEKIDVEINVDATSLNCSLISPQLNELIATVRDSIIDKELEPLKIYTIIEV